MTIFINVLFKYYMSVIRFLRYYIVGTNDQDRMDMVVGNFLRWMWYDHL